MAKRKAAAGRPARRERQETPKGGRGGAGPRRDLAWAAGLTLLAWVHRLLLLRSNRDFLWPYTFFYEGDSEAFFHYARALLTGELYDNGIPFHPPGFPLFLAAVHALVGAGAGEARVPHVAVKSVLALVGSLPVGLLYLVARPYLGRTVALLASLLCLYHFGLSVLAVAPVSEGLYLVLLLLALLLWSRRLEHPLAAPAAEPAARAPGLMAPLGLGLVLGWLSLTRAEGVAVAGILGAVGVAGWISKPGEGCRRRLAGLLPWALVAAGWVLVVAPWAVRNHLRLSAFNQRLAGQLAEPLPTFVPLTIYGPINLALANNPQADGSFSRDFLASQAQAGVLDLTNPEHLRFLLHGDEMARQYLREQPGGFARLVIRKWALFFGSWRLGWTQWDLPGGLQGVRRPVDVFVPDSGAALWIGPPLALFGLFLCLRAPGGPRRWAVLVLLLTAASLLTVALFFGYARLGLLLFPLWLSLVGSALAWVGERLLRRGASWRPALAPADPPRPLLRTLGALAVALFLIEAWGATTERNFRATGTNVPGQSYLNRDEDVYLEPIPKTPGTP